MRRRVSWWRLAAGTAIAMAMTPLASSAQRQARPGTSGDTGHVTRVRRVGVTDTITSRDSVEVVANRRYHAGKVLRYFMGDTYRDLWGQSITVPVLDLTQFAGGLTPTEEGGGKQTRSLRFESPDGRTWTFRPLMKDKLAVIEAWADTPLMDLVRDGLSGSFPGAPVVAPPFLEAADIPHPTPLLVVLADEERLGEFRKVFGGRLGTIEEQVSDAEHAPGFGGASEVIDSDKLLKRMNREPRRHVDTRLLLTARLIDIMLGDTDRHRDQWKWGLMRPGDSLFAPIPRDRDQVLATHDGLFANPVRVLKPYLVAFDSAYPRIETMVGYARDLDDRLLAEFDRTAWVAAAMELARAITDSVIHTAVYGLPAGYHRHLGPIEGKLRARRDHLPDAAMDYYGSLSRLVYVHATDHDDRARVERTADGFVQVTLGRTDAPWYARRFDPKATQEVRIYLHGGNDTAAVTGVSGAGITVRVVGGGGDNQLADSSTSPPRAGRTRLYDQGKTRNENYEPDSAFNRLPWLRIYGTSVRPGRDRGTSIVPFASLKAGRGLGIVPGLGIRQFRYGFRSTPYRTMVGLQAEYSTAVRRYRLLAQGDVRPPDMRLHLGGDVEMSEFAMVQYRGLGNASTYTRDPFYDVQQRQWIARPWAGYAFGIHRDVTLGPVVKYVVTDSLPNTFLSQTPRYGTGRFGQAGLELRLRHDTRDNASNPQHGVFMQVTGSSYPGLWSARTAFHRMAGTASTYLPVPVRKNAVLALRAGGAKVFGDHPFFEGAFLGGPQDLRAVNYHRLAGDASIFGNAELRIPVARVPLLLPWQFGLLGYAETGRVFVGGDSPGGWHRAVGAGFWLGILGPSPGVSVLFTNGRERQVLVGTGVSF